MTQPRSIAIPNTRSLFEFPHGTAAFDQWRKAHGVRCRILEDATALNGAGAYYLVFPDERSATLFEQVMIEEESVDVPVSFAWCLAKQTFKAHHGLTDYEFSDPVNQTLFEITYPECREAR